MQPPEFIRKWNAVDLSERAASQEHFLDLCKLVGVKTPAELDPTGETFTFEKGVAVAGPASAGSTGQRGYADVWYKGRFGWEYKRKGKYKTLDEAYRQLCQYREALENPPLLIVSDITRTEIHTNFTGFRSDVHVVELERLHEPEQLALLRRVFTDPGSFKPAETAEQVTARAAKNIGEIAQGLRQRGHDPHDAAHFLMKVMFCLFAEDVELLPKGLFQRILESCKRDPARLKTQMDRLFGAMRDGGDFGVDEIAYFNGGLFDDAEAIELTETEIKYLISAAEKDWGSVEPSVFGTLFERSLDPEKRAQIGAHYTSRDDIMLVIEPVVLRPLRRTWNEVLAECDILIQKRTNAARKEARKATAKGDIKSTTYTRHIENKLFAFQDRIASARVLDPACGSGNFLYVAIQQLLFLEKEVVTYAADAGSAMTPRVRPTQLYGIEINPYAAELAQVVIWIGYLQWMHANGFKVHREPILDNIASIENRDAILAWEDESGQPVAAWHEGAVCRGQAEWPEADFIVGNPPFLGGQNLISGTKASKRRPAQRGLGTAYVSSLRTVIDLPATSDLCCYWFEIARRALRRGKARDVGLLATQGIRGVGNRHVLERIIADTGIHTAWSDLVWWLGGADLHISIVCFGDARDTKYLDGTPVASIGSDLRSGVDVTSASPLKEMKHLAVQGPVKVGEFELGYAQARALLATSTPTGESPLNVQRPYMTGAEVSDRYQGEWIIDFHGLDLADAANYHEQFELIRRVVKPSRDDNNDAKRKRLWWLHGASGTEFRRQTAGLSRYVVCSRHMKDWTFRFVDVRVFPDSGLIAVPREDDYFFGLISSSLHEVWGRAQVSQVREAESGFRYTSRACMERFAAPWPPRSEPSDRQPGHQLHAAIARAAETLNAQRERWLNPPEWVEEVAAQVDAEDDFADVARVSGEEARRLIRQSAIDAASAKHPKLKERTLTNLYNERPIWLRLAHKALDEAVLAAYASVDPEGGWCAEWAEVFVETGAGQPLPEGHELTERRAEVEQTMLGALLRMNLERAGAE